MKADTLAELTKDIIRNAEFYSGSNDDEKNTNSIQTTVWIKDYANQRVIEELEWITSNKGAKETTFRALARLSNLKQD